MNELERRIGASDASDEEKRILASYRASGPSRAALEGALALASAGALSAAGSSKAFALKAWLFGGFGVLGVGALAVAVATGARHDVAPKTAAAAPSQAVAGMGDAAAHTFEEREAMRFPPEAGAAVSSEALERAPEPPPTGPPRTANPAIAPSSPAVPRPMAEGSAAAVASAARRATMASLPSETTLVAAAQASLARGNAALALTTIDEDLRLYPGGQLAPEAAAVRVDALEQTGSHAAATQEARDFLTKYPTSPYVGRMRKNVAR